MMDKHLYLGQYGYAGEAPIRVTFAVPPPPDWRYRVRQVLYVLAKVQIPELRPAMCVVNGADIPYFCLACRTKLTQSRSWHD